MHTLALAITNRCPLRCDFCCVPPGPGDLPEDVCFAIVDEVIQLKAFSNVGFTGGEPFLRLPLIARLGTHLTNNGISWGATTGGGWATSMQKVDDAVHLLKEAGIANLTVSFDEAHLKSKSRDWMAHLFCRLIDYQIPTVVSCTSNNVSGTLPFKLPTSQFLKVEHHYISPVGYAKGLPQYRHQAFNLARSKCPMPDALTLSVWPNGDVYPCCSTSVVNKEKSLVLGNVHKTSLTEILKLALNDPYLGCIREFGFSALALLTAGNAVWKSAFSEPLLDPCHLCSKIASKGAIASLRTELNSLMNTV